jgi:hypothetical protein
MSWNLNLQMIETCSCNMMCPCWYGVQELMLMDKGWCATAMALRIESTAVLIFDFPGPTLFDGDGTSRVYIDDGASEEQIRELIPILQGEKGGPMAILASLTSTWLPAVTAAMGVHEEGDSLSVTVEGFGEVKSDLLRNDAGDQVTMQNAGMGVNLGAIDVELAPSASRWSDPAMPRVFDTRSGGRSNVAWAP